MFDFDCIKTAVNAPLMILNVIFVNVNHNIVPGPMFTKAKQLHCPIFFSISGLFNWLLPDSMSCRKDMDGFSLRLDPTKTFKTENN